MPRWASGVVANDRRRQVIGLKIGWAVAVVAWASVAFSLPSLLMSADIIDEVPGPQEAVEDAELLKAFYAELRDNWSLSANELIGRVAAWSGSAAQREAFRADGHEKHKQAAALPRTDWQQKAFLFRAGGEAIVLGGAGSPFELEYAADCCFWSGDLLCKNGLSARGKASFRRSVVIYEEILAIVGAEDSELSRSVSRKRSRAKVELGRLSAVGGSGDSTPE